MIGRAVSPGVGIEQNSPDDCGKVTALPGSIVLKDAGNPLHVCGARVTRHESLNELAAPEGWHIGMRVEMIQGHRQGLGGLGAGRDRETQKRLRASFIATGHLSHRPPMMIWNVTIPASIINIPTSKDPGQTRNIGLGVGLLWLTVDQSRCAVQVELDQTDGEQLQKLAGVVLIGYRTRCGGSLGIAPECQKGAHLQRGTDVLPEGSQAPKGIGIQHIQPGSAAKCLPAPCVIEPVHSDDNDLGQRKCHALAQRVRRRNQPAPGNIIKTSGVEFIGRGIKAL